MDKYTPEQANELLKAIFEDNDYPETTDEKIDYAVYVMVHSLSCIGKAIDRLNRVNRLLLVGKGEMPEIILNNELRMALKPLLEVKEDINEIADSLMGIYKATKSAGEEDAKL